MLVAGWVVMNFAHETGHLIGGWLGGATLRSTELRPWRLAYSLHEPDPHPLLTLWAGPVLGVLMPLVLAVFSRHRFIWFLSNFCMLANGIYIAISWITGDRFLDSPRLIQEGAWSISLVAYCLFTIVPGYFLFRRSCVALFVPSPSTTLRPFNNTSSSQPIES